MRISFQNSWKIIEFKFQNNSNLFEIRELAKSSKIFLYLFYFFLRFSAFLVRVRFSFILTSIPKHRPIPINWKCSRALFADRKDCFHFSLVFFPLYPSALYTPRGKLLSKNIPSWASARRVGETRWGIAIGKLREKRQRDKVAGRSTDREGEDAREKLARILPSYGKRSDVVRDTRCWLNTK